MPGDRESTRLKQTQTRYSFAGPRPHPYPQPNRQRQASSGSFTRAAIITNLKAFGAEVLAEEDERAAAAGQEQQRELTGEEEMDMLQGWSSLADFASLDVDRIAEWEAFWAPTREGNGN